jgi:methionine-S-sulfoxide reductase
VGYAGGTTPSPTYRSIGDHSETLQVDYDPERISYAELLEVFWESHDPTARPWSRQYMSILFYHDEDQRRQAEASRDQQAEGRGRTIHTEIVPFSGFTLAENYHQKYRLRHVPELFRELSAIYPEPGDLVNSTAAARVNGYVGGYGTLEALEAGIADLGLSPAAQEKLLELVRARTR